MNWISRLKTDAIPGPGRCGLQPRHRCQFSDFSRYFVVVSLYMPPLRGLCFLAIRCYKHAVPYGTEEVFEVFKVSASYPVRLQTEPTGPGVVAFFF